MSDEVIELKTTVRITVCSPLRGMFARGLDVAARPQDAEARAIQSSLYHLASELQVWLHKDEPRLDAAAEMAAEIAAARAAFAREQERARPSDLLLHDDIEGRGFCVVRRYGAPGFAGGSWLCGYVDATGSRFDGIDDEDDPAFAGLGVEITYTGEGVPGCEGAPSTGWWIGFDTAHPGMEDETPESVVETIRGLVRAIGEEVRT